LPKRADSNGTADEADFAEGRRHGNTAYAKAVAASSKAEDPATDIGPMVSKGSASRVMAMCDDALAKGARFILQPQQDDATLSPGILTDVPTDARLWREEVFGPIVLVASFRRGAPDVGRCGFAAGRVANGAGSEGACAGRGPAGPIEDARQEERAAPSLSPHLSLKA
jgi:hypothetical protein